MFEALNKLKFRFRRAAATGNAGQMKPPWETVGAPGALGRETCGAVRGVSRRVVIVREPDPEIFEEAIFVVREDFLRGKGVGESELLREARRAAGDYVGAAFGPPPRRPLLLRAAPYIAAGTGAAVFLWLALRCLGVI